MKKQTSLVKAQQTVFGIIIGTFATGVLQIVFMLRAIDLPVDMSGFYGWISVMQLLPLIIFGVYWLVVRGGVWHRLFEASTLSIATALMSSAVGTLFVGFLWPFIWTYFNASVGFIVLNGVGILLYAVIVAVLIWCIKRRPSSAKLPSFGRKILIVAALMFFATTIIQTVAQVIGQYPSNPNLSAYGDALIGFGVTVVLVGGVFIAEKRRDAKRPFGNAVFITSIGLTAAYAVLSLFSLVTWQTLSQWVLAAIAAVGIVVGLAGFWWLYRTLRVVD